MDKFKLVFQTYSPKVMKLVSTHAVFGFILLFSGLAGFLILRSGQINRTEPTEKQVFDTKSEIQNIKIDENSLRVVEELTSRNISVESLFIERENPFEN